MGPRPVALVMTSGLTPENAERWPRGTAGNPGAFGDLQRRLPLGVPVTLEAERAVFVYAAPRALMLPAG